MSWIGMSRIGIWALALLLAAPGFAFAQSAGLTGENAGAVHGQGWNMRQNLATRAPDGTTLSRNERLRQQSATQRQARRQPTRAAQRAARRTTQPTSR